MAGSKRERRQPLDPRRMATRSRVVVAATRLFSQYGFRRTSVDTIAAAANVAKPTLYTYFRDKDALFLAVCEDVLDGITERARAAAVVADDVSVEERLLGVLAAKFTHLHQLVHSSPHAAELLGSSDRIASKLVEDADRRFNAILRNVLESEVARGRLDLARAGVSGPRLVDVLLRCGHGAGYHAADGAQHRRNLEEMINVVVVAMRPSGRGARRRRGANEIAFERASTANR